MASPNKKCFFTFTLGDLEAAGTTNPPTQATSRKPQLLGLKNVIMCSLFVLLCLKGKAPIHCFVKVLFLLDQVRNLVGVLTDV